LVSGIFSFRMHTVKELGYSGKVLALGIFLFVLLMLFSAFTYTVLKKTHKRAITAIYAVMLLISLAIFVSTAYSGPASRKRI